MKKLLSMLLAVMMVVGMFPLTAFAGEATIPDGLGILALSDAISFEEGEILEFSKWGMEGYSTPSWIVTVPAGTETVKITFENGSCPIYNDWQTGEPRLSGGWISYDAENGTYNMGGKDLAFEESNGGSTITLDVKSMIENGNYYVKYDGYYAEQYAIGFKYAEAEEETEPKAEIPAGLGILALSDAISFEEGEILEFSKWGMEGYSAPSWIVTVPAGTETVKITFENGSCPIYNDWQTGEPRLSGGWISYDAENGTYNMGGKDLAFEESNGGSTITLDVKSMIENGNYYVKYDGYYAEQYAIGFKYAEEIIETGAAFSATADKTEAEIGDTVEVTFDITDNTGFTNIELTLDFDTDVLKFTGLKINPDTESYEGRFGGGATVANSDPFSEKYGFITNARSSSTETDGKLFVAVFEVIGPGTTAVGAKISLMENSGAAVDFISKAVPSEDIKVFGISATAIYLDKTEISLEEGGSTAMISATLEPADTDDVIVWSSSDENVATVSKGVVTSVKAGTATITATAGSVFAECVVTVTPEENIIKKTPNNYSDYVDAEMTGVKSIQFNGETLEIRNIYKVTLAGYEECYIQCSKSDWSNGHAGYTLDGTHVMGDATWGTAFSSMRINGESGYQIKEYLVSYDDLKAAVGEENMEKLGVTEEDKLAVLVFKKVSASINYVILFDIDPVALEGISIDEKTEIDKGSTKKLKVTFVPSGADEVVTWKSSDESVATVDENGVVTAVSNGKATITATAGEFSDTCEVTVRTSIKNIPSNGDHRGNVTGIYVSGVEVDGYKWEDKTLTVYVDKNTNATATVVFGWFHSYNQGTSSTYEVEVKNGEGYLDEFREYGDWVVKFAPTTPTTVLTVESEATVVKGYEITLTATRNEDSTDEMSWSSSDESIATVDKNGKVRGVSEGKATITVKSGDLEASCEVTVILVHAESVTIVGDGIENGKLRVLKGKQIQLSEVTEPAEHTDEIKWSSSNTEVLSVFDWAPGYFRAEAPGTATVTVTVGEVSASIEVEVYEAPVEKITLDKTEATILNIETLVLNATTDPEEHTDGNIEWSSSDETVATVSRGARNSGTVTPVGVGEAIITAKVGNVSATCKVTVTEPEEGTVIWSYDGNSMNGWPQHVSYSYGIGALIMNGAKFDSVTEENGVYTVTLPHATAKDAEIALKVFACGATPNQLGVNWHEGEENPQSWNDYANKLEHTFSLTDGEATIKIRAYKASGAGASREGTKTFKFVIGGEHSFDQKVATEEHLASAATCTEAATYYMSCLCGENGTETFSDGEALGHDYESAVTAEATCTEPGVMTYTCKTCGDSYTEEIAIDPEAHKVSGEWTSENGKHFHICENGCGKRFDEADCSGGEATCAAKAICEVCGNEYGEIDADNHKLHYETVTEPGCETEGERRITCENGCDYEVKETIEALGHDWSAWETVKKPTYTEEGLSKRTCEKCGETETKAVAKLVNAGNKPNPGVTVIIPGEKAEDEENPNTGAPVVSAMGAMAVLAGAAIIISKMKKR